MNQLMEKFYKVSFQRFLQDAIAYKIFDAKTSSLNIYQIWKKIKKPVMGKNNLTYEFYFPYELCVQENNHLIIPTGIGSTLPASTVAAVELCDGLVQSKPVLFSNRNIVGEEHHIVLAAKSNVNKAFHENDFLMRVKLQEN